MHDILARMNWALGKSAGIFLSTWAIRYKADWDYNLSPQAAGLRWAIVLVSYFLASALPGSNLAYARVAALLIGLLFLCWPNFAWHLDRLIRPWPTIEGVVDSRESTEDGWRIGYNFFLGDERYGGYATVRPDTTTEITEAFPEGKRLVVRYDPYNPECSRLA